LNRRAKSACDTVPPARAFSASRFLMRGELRRLPFAAHVASPIDAVKMHGIHSASLKIVQRLTLYERAIWPCVSLPVLRRLIASCFLREGNRNHLKPLGQNRQLRVESGYTIKPPE
jgi:hypothetical protein